MGVWVLKALRRDLVPLQKPLLDSMLASCHLMTFMYFIDFYGFIWISIYFDLCSLIFIDFYGFRGMDA